MKYSVITSQQLYSVWIIVKLQNINPLPGFKPSLALNVTVIHLLSKNRGRVATPKPCYTHINPQNEEGTKTNQKPCPQCGSESQCLAARRERGRRSSQGTSDRSYNEDVVIYPLAPCSSPARA